MWHKPCWGTVNTWATCVTAHAPFQELAMTTLSSGLITPTPPHTAPIHEHIDRVIADLLASFPNPEQLSANERRGIIARYTAVLEGNFIYWMTAAYLAVR